MLDSQPPETPDATPARGSHIQQPAAAQDAVQFEIETTAPSGHTNAWSRLWNAGGIVHRPLTVRQKLWRIGGLTLALVALLASHAEPAQPAQFGGVLSALRWSPDGPVDGAIVTL